MNVISVDVGTSSLRVILYSQEGAKLKEFAQEYTSEYFGAGFVEQDPLTWQIALIACLTQLGAYMNQNELTCEAITVTSQRSSLIPVDKAGNALHKAMMWQDKRSLPQCDALIEKYTLQGLYRKTGLRVNPYFVLPKLLWLKENEPEMFAESYMFVGVQDYVVYQLTDSWATDYSQACRTLMMDIRHFSWDTELLDEAGITPARLPKLLPPGAVAGKLSASVADLTGLPVDLPVILAGGDQQNAALALGVLQPGTAEANTGTGSFVISASDEPVFDEESRILCQASAVPGKWILEAGIFNTGAIYRWFRNEFCKEIRVEDSYHVMNKEAMVVPIGSGGVMMLPHFEGAAAPYWNPLAKGLFFNLSLGTKRSFVARSIMEGIALEINENLSLMENLIGKIHQVSVAGGMTKSNLFCEIQSSIYDKEVIRHVNSEASSLGSAMTAFITLGVYKDMEEAFAHMVAGEPSVFEPKTEDVRKYSQVIERKRALYKALNTSDIYRIFTQPIE